MRASKKHGRAKARKRGSVEAACKINSSPLTPNPSLFNEHISGAEGIYEEAEIQKIIKKYSERALNHPRGRPDEIIISIEKIEAKPRLIKSLPIVTLKCDTSKQAKANILKILSEAGIGKKAVDTAFRILDNKNPMRGAALVFSESGTRAEPDRERGVRASRIGITKKAEKKLSAELRKFGINTTTVKEAAILASKILSCPEVISELCVSDDPDYITGYVSLKNSGYVRITNIKKKGDSKGGRVIFIKEQSDIESVVVFLKKHPVLINKISKCRGICTIDEIFNSNNR